MMPVALFALSVGTLFVGAHLRAPRRRLLALGLMWLLYGGYELLIAHRVLCSGECNIRVDLLLF